MSKWSILEVSSEESQQTQPTNEFLFWQGLNGVDTDTELEIYQIIFYSPLSLVTNLRLNWGLKHLLP